MQLIIMNIAYSVYLYYCILYYTNNNITIIDLTLT